MSAVTRLLFAMVMVFCATINAYGGDSGSNSVRRGEYANALSSLHDLPVEARAPYMIMAGDLKGAVREISTGDDPLLETFLMFRLEEWEGVLERSRESCPSPWLDIFRLHMRTAAFMAMGMADSVIVLTSPYSAGSDEDHGIYKDHHLYEEILALRVKAIFTVGREDLMADIDPGLFDHLDNETLLMITARGSIARDSSLLERSISHISAIDMEDDEPGLLKEIISRIISDEEYFGRDILTVLGRKAIDAKLYTEAGAIIDILREHDDYSWQAAYLRGRLLEKKKQFRQARKKFRDLFRSNAPVSLKKDSLLRITSIDYRLKNLKRSAENLRLFGVYYPDDRRAESVLDRAARIHLARKKESEAIEVWEILSEMDPSSRQGRAGVISLSVLHLTAGRNTEARAVLSRLIRSDGSLLKDGAMYWMYRASEDSDSARAWLERLEVEFPLSIYAYAAGRESEALLVTAPEEENLSRMEELEKNSVSTVLREKDLLDDDIAAPVVEAFKYLAGNGLLPEAADCAMTLTRLWRNDPDRLWFVYRVLRERGMIRSGIRVLDALSRVGSARSALRPLRFPVPYAGLISKNSKRREVPAELVLSVIREESLFEVEAVSGAGALGLMQLMPSTGSWIAGKLKMDPPDTDGIFDPVFNIEAGTWYLRFLLDRSKDSIVGALASYNAGNAKMSAWKKAYKPHETPMIAMEMIGLRETREYVRRVLGSYAAYKVLYQGEDDRR